MPEETTGLKESRPTIVVDSEVNGPLGGGLLTLMIVENTNGLYRCEAKFGNWGEKNSTTDFLYFDRRVLDFGKDFEIKLANESNTSLGLNATVTNVDFSADGHSAMLLHRNEKKVKRRRR